MESISIYNITYGVLNNSFFLPPSDDGNLFIHTSSGILFDSIRTLEHRPAERKRNEP